MTEPTNPDFKRPLSKARRAERDVLLRARWIEGASSRELARTFGLTKDQVNRLVRDLRLEHPREIYKPKPLYYGWKARKGEEIQTLYAWIATEPDGTEAICGMPIAEQGPGILPLIGPDLKQMRGLRAHAERTRAWGGVVSVSLVEFGLTRKVLEHW